MISNQAALLNRSTTLGPEAFCVNRGMLKGPGSPAHYWLAAHNNELPLKCQPACISAGPHREGALQGSLVGKHMARYCAEPRAQCPRQPLAMLGCGDAVQGTAAPAYLIPCSCALPSRAGLAGVPRTVNCCLNGALLVCHCGLSPHHQQVCNTGAASHHRSLFGPSLPRQVCQLQAQQVPSRGASK